MRVCGRECAPGGGAAAVRGAERPTAPRRALQLSSRGGNGSRAERRAGGSLGTKREMRKFGEGRGGEEGGERKEGFWFVLFPSSVLSSPCGS